jgi:hypothetical protein
VLCAAADDERAAVEMSGGGGRWLRPAPGGPDAPAARLLLSCIGVALD